MTNPLVQLRAHNLAVSYDQHVALNFEQLDITGNVIAILGHNGAGKSTLIKTILGLLPVKAGSLKILGSEGEKFIDLIPEQHMAFCPENGAVFADISVESYFGLWSALKCGSRKYYKQEGAHYLELMDIPPLLKKLGRELSKGQRRRVQAAIGFITSPRLFLFDEPFDGLDVQRTHELASLLTDQARSRSIMLSSHRMDVVERVADHAIVIREGRIVASGETAAVCRALCPAAYSVQGKGDLVLLRQKLEQALPSHVISVIGNQIIVAGADIDWQQSRAESDIQTADWEDFQIEPTRVSLVEAMSYHLRAIS